MKAITLASANEINKSLQYWINAREELKNALEGFTPTYDVQFNHCKFFVRVDESEHFINAAKAHIEAKIEHYSAELEKL